MVQAFFKVSGQSLWTEISYCVVSLVHPSAFKQSSNVIINLFDTDYVIICQNKQDEPGDQKKGVTVWFQVFFS